LRPVGVDRRPAPHQGAHRERLAGAEHHVGAAAGAAHATLLYDEEAIGLTALRADDDLRPRVVGEPEPVGEEGQCLGLHLVEGRMLPQRSKHQGLHDGIMAICGLPG
jgi:hypothetical protein